MAVSNTSAQKECRAVCAIVEPPTMERNTWGSAYTAMAPALASNGCTPSSRYSGGARRYTMRGRPKRK